MEKKKSEIKNNIAVTHPEVAEEWHPVRNGSLNPDSVSAGSTIKVWWLGKCGHEWETSPNNRIRKGRPTRGCPYCSGNKVLVGFNDLFTTHQNLANEWNYSKNDSISPENVSAGSEKNVWWIDNFDHEWEASIKSRAKGRGCPYCARKRLLVGFNDMATTHPELSKEWHPTKNGALKPEDVISGTHKKIWWLCENGHEWQATCNSRADNGRGCPKCSKINGAKLKNENVITKQGSLADNNEELSLEWHPTKNGNKKPSDFLSGSDKKVWWLGKCGHEWKARIKDRNDGVGCPYCSNKKLLQGFNDLETCVPFLASEWHPTKNADLKPNSVLSGSGNSVWWKCRICDNDWKAKIISRRRGSGCPQCSSEKNTSYPEQAIFYYIKKILPDAINRYVLEKHELDIFLPSIMLGIEYDGSYYHTEDTKDKEIEKDSYFANNGIRVIHIKESGKKEKYDTENTIYYKPSSNYSTLDSMIKNLFEILHNEYKIEINSIIDSRKDMSDILSGYLTSIKEKSLTKICPELISEWNHDKNGSLNPEYVNSNSNKKVWWKCKQNHEWQAVVYTRKNGAKCPYCSNKKVWPGYNDLATHNPILALEWNYEKNKDLLPSMVTKGSSKKVWWKCKNCCHEWQASIVNRNNGSGCPKC